MATHESAKKRIRQNEKRRLVNRSRMSTMRTAIKKVHDIIASGDLSTLDAAFRDAQTVIARTRKVGVIHKNNMARRIGRLARRVNLAKAGKKA